jgi:hypothetical protein
MPEYCKSYRYSYKEKVSVCEFVNELKKIVLFKTPILFMQVQYYEFIKMTIMLVHNHAINIAIRINKKGHFNNR